MKRTAKITLLIALTFLIQGSTSFQVPQNKLFREAVEKTTGETVSNISTQPLAILDDTSFSRQIPCEVSEQQQIARPLSKCIKTKQIISPRRDPVTRKRIGIDDMPTEYWCVNFLWLVQCDTLMN
eukprot:981582_1